jgi:hypothetical protein
MNNLNIKLRRQVQFIIALERIKYSGINLTKKCKTCTLETMKYHWEKLKKIWINEKTTHVHDLENLVLLRGQCFLHCSTCSMKFQSEDPFFFSSETCIEIEYHPSITFLGIYQRNYLHKNMCTYVHSRFFCTTFIDGQFTHTKMYKY